MSEMNEEQALAMIKDLEDYVKGPAKIERRSVKMIKDFEEFVKGLDSKKTVLVYVRKNADKIKPKGADPYFATGMRKLLGTEVTLFQAGTSDVYRTSTTVEDWVWAPEWFVVLEGNLDDFETE